MAGNGIQAGGKGARRRGRLPWRWLIPGAAVALGVGVLWLLWPFWRLSGQFSDIPQLQPSRLYGASTLLSREEVVDGEALAVELAELGYREVPASEPLARGEYQREGSRWRIHLRPFPTPNGAGGGERLEIEFGGRRIAALRLGGEAVEGALLEPPLLASYYGPRLEERRPVTVDELPEELVEAVLAVEDARFFKHRGLSLLGILRAAWVNLTGGEIRQGGSTLTQQLAKNLYLSHERTLARKLREAVLAVFLELRYSKREILQAYLNEIYMGSSGGAQLLGMGAAARAYFGKEAGQLGLTEAATLAGMIQAPAHYDPRVHPERARARRDLVLARMAELEVIEPERAARARERPLEVAPRPVVLRRAPHFAEAAAEEARRRFGAGALEDGGYVLLSTLSWRDQRAAEEAVGWGLASLEKGWQKGHRGDAPLEAALVSLDPRDGGILAYIGGRDYARSQFDRAGQALRQAGSAFKPVVYAAAFEAGVAWPSTLLEDEPLTVTLAGRPWNPRNDDGEFFGWVSARRALEESRNVPTVRLALQVGLKEVVETARRMGVTSPLEPVPALALGAFEVTPVEMATIYATLAAAGRRPPVHGLRAVFDRRGQPLVGAAPGALADEEERALSAEAAYLVTSVLQGVLDRGTGAGARRQGLKAPLAGKTGTTNGRRDSWFGGYAPDRATVVWVGYDDNSTTRLSGARAALPVWTRFTYATRPVAGFPTFPQPRGIVTAVIDPESGGLATDRCPEVFTEVFPEGRVPKDLCYLHRGFWVEPLEQPDGVEPQEEPHRFRDWLRRVFGRRERSRPR